MTDPSPSSPSTSRSARQQGDPGRGECASGRGAQHDVADAQGAQSDARAGGDEESPFSRDGVQRVDDLRLAPVAAAKPSAVRWATLGAAGAASSDTAADGEGVGQPRTESQRAPR